MCEVLYGTGEWWRWSHPCPSYLPLGSLVAMSPPSCGGRACPSGRAPANNRLRGCGASVWWQPFPSRFPVGGVLFLVPPGWHGCSALLLSHLLPLVVRSAGTGLVGATPRLVPCPPLLCSPRETFLLWATASAAREVPAGVGGHPLPSGPGTRCLTLSGTAVSAVKALI